MSILQKAKATIQSRRRKYLATFSTPTGNEVLKDLARFCYAHQSAASESEKTTYIALGRQEVWLRIQHYLQLSDEELWELYQIPKNSAGN